MTFNEIKELVKTVSDSKLRTIEITSDGFNIKMSKNLNDNIQTGFEKKQEVCVETTCSNDVEILKLDQEPSDLNQQEIIGNIVTAPIVGTFYSKSGPNNPSFVKKGDHVKKGDTLCIIEAMKIMNEIVSGFDGVVENIYANDDDLVEYGQKLFNIV